MEANHDQTFSEPLIGESERAKARQTTKLPESEQMAEQAELNRKSMPAEAFDKDGKQGGGNDGKEQDGKQLKEAD